MLQRVTEWQTKIKGDVGRPHTDLTVQTSKQNKLVLMWKKEFSSLFHRHLAIFQSSTAYHTSFKRGFRATCWCKNQDPCPTDRYFMIVFLRISRYQCIYICICIYKNVSRYSLLGRIVKPPAFAEHEGRRRYVSLSGVASRLPTSAESHHYSRGRRPACILAAAQMVLRAGSQFWCHLSVSENRKAEEWPADRPAEWTIWRQWLKKGGASVAALLLAIVGGGGKKEDELHRLLALRRRRRESGVNWLLVATGNAYTLAVNALCHEGAEWVHAVCSPKRLLHSRQRYVSLFPLSPNHVPLGIWISVSMIPLRPLRIRRERLRRQTNCESGALIYIPVFVHGSRRHPICCSRRCRWSVCAKCTSREFRWSRHRPRSSSSATWVNSAYTTHARKRKVRLRLVVLCVYAAAKLHCSGGDKIRAR